MKPNLEAQLEMAERIATAAHEGQQRWSGEPYIMHPRAVQEIIRNREYDQRYVTWKYIVELRVIAWLHDVVEDTEWTLKDLEEEGFSPSVIWAVNALTQKDNETYSVYVERVRGNDRACWVKLADLQHNLSNLKEGNMRQKYLLAKMYLELVLSS